MHWQTERVIVDGDNYFEAVFERIDRAQTSIDFETYIFENDQIGLEVENRLARAVKRGVRVRLVVDGIGSSQWWQSRGNSLLDAGVDVRVYHPIYFTEMWRRLLVDLKLASPQRKPMHYHFLRRLNRRTHRKMVIIDNEIAFVGSVNVAAVHCARYSLNTPSWRDTSLELTGRYVADLIHGFEFAWVRSQSLESIEDSIQAQLRPRLRLFLPKRTKLNESPVHLNFTTRLRRFHRLRFSKKIELARKRIWIQNAYLAPPSNIVRKLTSAALRGVDVKIIVPARSDVWFMTFIARAYYRWMHKAGIKIYEYQPRFLHAKVILFDDEAQVGSSNLNRRSFLHDLEVDVAVNSPESIGKISEQFEFDLKNSLEISRHSTAVGARIGRLLNFLFRYWV